VKEAESAGTVDLLLLRLQVDTASKGMAWIRLGLLRPAPQLDAFAPSYTSDRGDTLS
jgi:hypothetical protein